MQAIYWHESNFVSHLTKPLFQFSLDLFILPLKRIIITIHLVDCYNDILETLKLACYHKVLCCLALCNRFRLVVIRVSSYHEHGCVS